MSESEILTGVRLPDLTTCSQSFAVVGLAGTVSALPTRCVVDQQSLREWVRVVAERANLERAPTDSKSDW